MKSFEYFLQFIKENTPAPFGANVPNDGSVLKTPENMLSKKEIHAEWANLVKNGWLPQTAIQKIAKEYGGTIADIFKAIEDVQNNIDVNEAVYKIQKPGEEAFKDVVGEMGTCTACDAKNVTVANHVCTTKIEEASSASIQRKVNEINRLIALAVDGDGDRIGVIDTTGTWQAEMFYKPVIYSNGGLRIEYEERNVKGGFDLHKDKILKPQMDFDGIPTLNQIAKMYRLALKRNNILFKENKTK